MDKEQCVAPLRMIIGVVRGDGATACMAIGEATDTEVFRAFVGNVFMPSRVIPNGDEIQLFASGALRKIGGFQCCLSGQG